MKQKNTKLLAVLLLCAATFSAKAQNWLLNGNAGINGNTNFVGTTDNKPLVFRTFNKERMRIMASGRIGIGTSKVRRPGPGSSQKRSGTRWRDFYRRKARNCSG